MFAKTNLYYYSYYKENVNGRQNKGRTEHVIRVTMNQPNALHKGG